MGTTTPLGAIGRGLAAGAVGTLAMDLFWYARHLTQGGRQDPISWEFGGPSEWDKVSAPGQVGRRLVEGFLQRPIPERWARLTNNLVHWGYGAAWGAAFGVAAGSAARVSKGSGLILGSAVWLSSYVTLPIAGLYKPMWEYKPKDLAPDLASHLVYGIGTALGFAASTA